MRDLAIRDLRIKQDYRDLRFKDMLQELRLKYRSKQWRKSRTRVELQQNI